MGSPKDGKEPCRILCVGLPGTGKTTFLVALYHIVQGGDDSAEMRLEDGFMFEADRNYIQMQRERWLEYQQVERNKTDAKGSLVLTLATRGGGAPVRLDIPDLSGETFRSLVDDRIAPANLLARAAAADAVLVFVNPAKVSEPKTIHEATAALIERPMVQASVGVSVDSDDDGPDAAQEFLASQSCTAVKLVELVQLLELGTSGRRLPVALVVSALDLLDGTKHANQPEAYVEERLSLFHQYMRANHERFLMKVFGISAQGAAYTQSERVSELELLPSASSRIRVVPVPQNLKCDVSVVVSWLLGACV